MRRWYGDARFYIPYPRFCLFNNVYISMGGGGGVAHGFLPVKKDMATFEEAAIAAALGGAAGGRSEGGDRGGQQDGVTLDKETRHQLMEYFIFRPSEEKNGPLARDLASAERGGGGVGGNPSASSPQIPSPSEAPGASLASLPFAWIERRREKEQSQSEGGGGGGQEEGKNVVVADAEVRIMNYGVLWL